MKVKNAKIDKMEFEVMTIPVVVNVKVSVPNRGFLGTSGLTEVYTKSERERMAKDWAKNVLSWSINLHPPLAKGQHTSSPTVNCYSVAVVEAKVKL